MAQFFNSKVGSDVSLKLNCSLIQIGYRALIPSEELLFTKNAIRIKFPSLKEPLMISNCGIVKIELFPKAAKTSINTSTKTWKRIQTYLNKCNEYISTCSDIDKIIINADIDNANTIKVLKNIYMEKIEELDLFENVSASKNDTSKIQPLQQQVCNVNNF